MPDKYEGPDRRNTGENFEEHDKAITQLQTTITNGRWVLGVFGSISLVVLSFFLWVANDNLSSIRSKLDKIEALYINNQRDLDKIKIELDYLKRWQVEVEEHIKGRK